MNAFSHLKVASLSDVGKKRKNNEDAFGTFPAAGVFCVADGMGGGDDGEIASAAVVRAVEEATDPLKAGESGGYGARDVGNAVARGLTKASAWICNRAHERKLNGCGSTFVGAVFDATDPAKALAVHAGDSRLYLLHGRSITQITRDHSVAELMGEKDESKVNPMFRSMVVNGIGIRPKADPEFTPFKVAPGDRVLICSDGLSRMVPDKKLLAASRSESDPKMAVKALIAAALDAGGADNVTAVLIEVGELPPPLARLETPAAPVEESDAETEDGPTSDGGATGSTGGTSTCATMLTGIAEEEAFGDDSGDGDKPDASVGTETGKSVVDDAEDERPPRRLPDRRIACICVAAACAILAVVFAVVAALSGKSSPKPATPAPAAKAPPPSVPAVKPVDEKKPKPAEEKAAVQTLAAARKEVASARTNAAAKSAVVIVETNVIVAAAVKTNAAPATAAKPDPSFAALAAACDEKTVRAFVRTLKRLKPKGESQLDFDAEAEQFLKSARRFARMRTVKDAEMAAVDLRVLLLNADSVKTELLSRRTGRGAAEALAAWNGILSDDPSKASAQMACARLIRSLQEVPAR